MCKLDKQDLLASLLDQIIYYFIDYLDHTKWKLFRMPHLQVTPFMEDPFANFCHKLLITRFLISGIAKSRKSKLLT